MVSVTDAEDVKAMVKRTRVVCNCVGCVEDGIPLHNGDADVVFRPFIKFGEVVVNACVEEATEYCDITGETKFVKKMVDQYHDQAVSKNVLVVNACGFDSIPTDVGAFHAKKLFVQTYNEPPALMNVRCV